MPLNQSVVLEAALQHLDEEGLDGFSTRKLAARLGVRVGALYWHFESKQALLDAIAERIATEAIDALPPPPGDLAEQLRAIGRALRGAMLARTDGARVIAGMSHPGPAAGEFIALPIAVLQQAGLSADDAAAATDALTSYVNGYTVEEQARKQSQSRAERDRLFEFGLTVVVNGVGSLL
ncbi:TetR/AcrR family transcriptional regulator C-terminal domain-containing protein [Streptomyces sp. NPDC090442]|uniref:TetR/AcrR family transcriptional regulator C-terminal domain-containing protein n=1 Tax=Streptomyces sp. NPDC090442 TaxID=3365962 RepID=UPI00380C802D